MSNNIKALPASKIELRKLASGMTAKELRRVIEVFNKVAEKIEAEERKVEIKALQRRMAEIGISPEDLVTPGSSSKAAGKSKTAKVQPKYAITVDGKVTKWSGRGRKPRVFQNFVDQGGYIETLLINGS